MPVSRFYAEAEMEGARGQLENIHFAYMEALNSISCHLTLFSLREMSHMF